MIVVSNRVPVAKEHEVAFAARFRNRAGLVEHHPGFVRLELLRPESITLDGQQMGGSDYQVVLTYWEQKEDFIAWIESEDFRTAHSQRAPEEMFAGPNVFEMHEIVQLAGKAVDVPSMLPDRSTHAFAARLRSICPSHARAASLKGALHG